MSIKKHKNILIQSKSFIMNSKSNELTGAAHKSTASGNSRDLSKVLLGALAGAAAGSIIGSLFTEKGIEIRMRVSEVSKNMANNFKDKATDITEGIADKYEAAKESAADLIKKGKQKVSIFSRNTAHKSTMSAGAKGTGFKVVLGASAASVAGLIIWSFAAEKGIETRKRLGKGSKKMANNLKGKFTNIADGIADTYEAAKEGAEDLIEKGRQHVDLSSGPTAYKGSADADLYGHAMPGETADRQ